MVNDIIFQGTQPDAFFDTPILKISKNLTWSKCRELFASAKELYFLLL